MCHSATCYSAVSQAAEQNSVSKAELGAKGGDLKKPLLSIGCWLGWAIRNAKKEAVS